MKGQSYCRLQQTCRGVGELVRKSHKISVHLGVRYVVLGLDGHSALPFVYLGPLGLAEINRNRKIMNGNESSKYRGYVNE